ncbi:MAG: sigma-70 family RNA polymerase sigma factor [Bdellovibrionaceae bacterium]|nr:sigma-70 family RNA polymerase sigma factor [Pseudobdellovibrionaceae bacterium]MDW8190635.1 sigma-70 family RNA polymerase sigma factor [Pseudobdellovibrionaceae bacterium]
MTQEPFYSELEVISRVLSGQIEAYSWIVKRYKTPLFRLGLKMTGDLAMVDDVVQETFIKAYQKLGTFAGRSSFKSWLYQIFMNTLRNFLRKKPVIPLEKCVLKYQDPMLNKLHHQQIANILEEAIQQLPPRQKMAVTLRIYEDLSFEEIAYIMGSPYDTAKANFRHGLLKLKTVLEKHGNILNSLEDPEPVVHDVFYHLEEGEVI